MSTAVIHKNTVSNQKQITRTQNSYYNPLLAKSLRSRLHKDDTTTGCVPPKASRYFLMSLLSLPSRSLFPLSPLSFFPPFSLSPSHSSCVWCTQRLFLKLTKPECNYPDPQHTSLSSIILEWKRYPSAALAWVCVCVCVGGSKQLLDLNHSDHTTLKARPAHLCFQSSKPICLLDTHTRMQVHSQNTHTADVTMTRCLYVVVFTPADVGRSCCNDNVL